jgi:predicted transposase YbfD/YdcC
VQYRTFRTEKGKETVQTDRYYLSSGDFSADEFLKYIRGHWSIENQLHWMLDITFREDECRQTPHDARRPGFGFPVSGIVLRVNADALIL